MGALRFIRACAVLADKEPRAEMIEPPWEPDTRFGFVSFVLERGGLFETLRQSPLHLVPYANPACLVTFVLAMYSLGALAVQRRASVWNMGAAGAILPFIVADFALAYRRAHRVLAGSKVPWKEEWLTDWCQELLWIPTLNLLISFVVSSAAAISPLRCIATGRADAPDAHQES